MTTAKEVQVSTDGVTYYTLPGMQGSWDDEADQIADTIFGHTFESTQTGLIGWSVDAQAYYKGFAGYVAVIKSSGTPTSSTASAMTLVSGKTYQATDATKRVWSRANAVTVKDGVTNVTAQVESIDYLLGRVTFKSSYTVVGTITVDHYYLPMTTVGKASSFTLTQSVSPIDETDFATAQGNGGYRVFRPGLRSITLELGGFYDVASAFWDVLESRSELIIEINPDGSGLSFCRGFFKMVTRGQSGDVGALEEETRSFRLAVPDGISPVFTWYHANNTTLAQAIRILLDAFLNETLVYVRYAPEGDEGLMHGGQAVLTDVSLSSGLDAMNEFNANFQGSGAPTREVESA